MGCRKGQKTVKGGGHMGLTYRDIETGKKTERSVCVGGERFGHRDGNNRILVCKNKEGENVRMCGFVL